MSAQSSAVTSWISVIIETMKKSDAEYLERSLKRLEKWLPFPVDEMLAHYLDERNEIRDHEVEEDPYGYVYCLFSWPETDHERLVLLVYDEQMRIIADLSAVHANVSELLYSAKLYDELSEESDWMYLEHYTLCAYMFPELPYPASEAGEQRHYEGEALLYSNAYVTKQFRRRGIFTAMVSMTRDFALRRASGSTVLYSVFSLDPDIAVYGPDAESTPYHYSYEKDEPVRMTNCEIMKKLGFTPLRLEETEEDPEADGTKLWFAVKQETDLIIDVDEKTVS